MLSSCGTSSTPANQLGPKESYRDGMKRKAHGFSVENDLEVVDVPHLIQIDWRTFRIISSDLVFQGIIARKQDVSTVYCID